MHGKINEFQASIGFEIFISIQVIYPTFFQEEKASSVFIPSKRKNTKSFSVDVDIGYAYLRTKCGWFFVSMIY